MTNFIQTTRPIESSIQVPNNYRKYTRIHEPEKIANKKTDRNW
jgi:hypothetical protein